MVEVHHALRDMERMVIGNRDDTGAESDAVGPFRRRDQEHFRRADRFPTGGMMLAHPKLVVLQFVDPAREFEIALELQGGVLTNGMVRGEKDAEAEPL
jgi:hypothetical protein